MVDRRIEKNVGAEVIWIHRRDDKTDKNTFRRNMDQEMLAMKPKVINGLFVILLSIVIFLSIRCELPIAPPIEQDNPTIVYSVAGGLLTQSGQLTISSDGMASLLKIYPLLTLQLSQGMRDSLSLLLQGFDSYVESYDIACDDCSTYMITLQTAKKSKTVVANDAAFFSNPKLQKLATFVYKMESLRYRIYNEKASWLGLTYRFGLDTTTYRSGDTVRYFCHISNPATDVRSLFFRNKYRMILDISGDFPNFISAYVPSFDVALTDTSFPAQIDLAPGQETEFSFQWDQSFDYKGVHYSKLPVGTYRARIIILAGMTSAGWYPEKWNINFSITN